MKKKILTVLAAILAAALLMSACGTVAQDNGAVGSIMLSVNPEIEIEYNRHGLVVELEGINEDGKTVLSQYTDFEGKTCQQVMEDLVQLIYDAGCFELELDGNPKNIVIKLEEGSAYPSDDFLNELAAGIQAVVESRGSKSDTMVVDSKDLDKNGLIGLEKAKELVLAQLNFTEADFTEKEYELDDGIYELEFTVNGVEYDYEVDGRTGKILKADMENNDDWNEPVITPNLTMEEAKALVFAQLGVTEDQLTRKEFTYDADDGKFELDFCHNGTEYEYEVDGRTGKILKTEKEHDSTPAGPTPALSAQEAKALVFAQLGITEADISFLTCELDDGKYEVEFHFGNMEYDYEVDAATGKILKAEKEPADRD